jgi:ABC-type multidrug transport system ATPase subunit
MEEAEELCDRVGIIDNGKLISLGTPQQLKKQFKDKTLELSRKCWREPIAAAETLSLE